MTRPSQLLCGHRRWRRRLVSHPLETDELPASAILPEERTHRLLPRRVRAAVRGDIDSHEAARRQTVRCGNRCRRTRRFGQRFGRPGRVVEEHPRSAVGHRALGHTAVDSCVSERQAFRVETRVDDRIHLRQKNALDLFAPLDQDVGQVLLRFRIAELSGVDGRSDHVVGKGGDPPRRPEGVVVSKLHVCSRRCLRPPRPWVEDLALELANRWVLDVVDGLPRAQAEPEREEALPRWPSLEEVLVAEVPFVIAVAHAEGRADVLQVMLDDRLAVLRDHRVHGVRRL